MSKSSMDKHGNDRHEAQIFLDRHAAKSAVAPRARSSKASQRPSEPFDAEYASQHHGHGAEGLASLYAPSYHFGSHHRAHAALRSDADAESDQDTAVGAAQPKLEEGDLMPERRHPQVWRRLDAVSMHRQHPDIDAGVIRNDTANRRAARRAYRAPRTVDKATLLRVPASRRVFAQPPSLSATEPHNEDAPVQAGIGDALHEWVIAYADNDAVMQRLFHNEAVQYAQERGMLRGRWRNTERARGLLPRLKQQWWGRPAKGGKGGVYTWGSVDDTVHFIHQAQQRAHQQQQIAQEQQWLRSKNRLPRAAAGSGGVAPAWTRRVASHLLDDLYESHGEGGELKPRITAADIEQRELQAQQEQEQEQEQEQDYVSAHDDTEQEQIPDIGNIRKEVSAPATGRVTARSAGRSGGKNAGAGTGVDTDMFVRLARKYGEVSASMRPLPSSTSNEVLLTSTTESDPGVLATSPDIPPSTQVNTRDKSAASGGVSTCGAVLDAVAGEASSSRTETNAARLAAQVLWLYLANKFRQTNVIDFSGAENAVQKLRDSDLASAATMTELLPTSARPLYETLMSMDSGVRTLAHFAEDFLPVLAAVVVPWAQDHCREVCDKGRAVAAVMKCAIDAGVGDAGQALVEVGVDLDALYSEDAATVLAWGMFAESGAGAAVVQSMIAAKADVNQQDKRGNTALLYSIDYFHRAAASALIAAGACLHTRNQANSAPLPHAVFKKDVVMVDILLDAKADVEQRSAEGIPPLVMAAKGGDAPILRKLLAAKASVDSACAKGRTALLEAVEQGRADMVQLLVDAGATTTLLDVKGNTALMVAVKKQDTDVLRVLVMAGVDANMRSNSGITALVSALKAKNETMVDLLLQAKANASARSSDGECPLLLALEFDSEPLVAKLLNAKANPDVVDGQGNSALLQAVAKDHLGLVRLLVAARAPLNAIDSKRNTALLAAVSKKNTEIVRVLADAGADLSMRGRVGVSALLAAVEMQEEAMVQILTEAKADVEQEQSSGLSPLCLAARHGNVALMNVLLAAKADVNRISSDGSTALTVAVNSGHSAIVERLKTAETAQTIETQYSDATLQAMAQKTVRNIVRTLANAGANVDAVDETGKTLLMTAIEKEDVGMVQLLLEAKANIDMRYKNGKSALLSTVSQGQTRLARMLLAGKANPSVIDHCGNTALLLAAYKGNTELAQLLKDAGAVAGVDGSYRAVTDMWLSIVKKKDAQIVQILVDAGADVNVCNAKGESALLLATQAGAFNLVKIMLSAKAAVNKRDFAQETPLLSALRAKNPNMDLLRALLAAKADPGMIDRHGKSALDVATSKGLHNVVSELASTWVVSRARNTHTDAALLLRAIADGDKEAVQVLLDHGVTADVCDARGQSAVMCAVMADNIPILQTLVDAGAALDTCDDGGMSPLALSVSRRNVEAVQVLVTAGASLRCLPQGKSIVDVLHEQNDVAMISIIKDAHDAAMHAPTRSCGDGRQADTATTARVIDNLLVRMAGLCQ